MLKTELAHRKLASRDLIIIFNEKIGKQSKK